MIDVKIMEGDKDLPAYSFNIITLDGILVPINALSGPGTVANGISMTWLPTLMADGKIKVAISISKAEAHMPDYNSVPPLKRNEVSISLPQIDVLTINTYVVVSEKQERAIPFGPLDDAGRSKYTIKVVARKVHE